MIGKLYAYRRSALISLLTSMVTVLVPPRIRAATPAQVDAAMTKAIAALYAAQKNGNWELVQARSPANESKEVTGGQWTGLTALSTYALLSAGEDEKDPRIAAAIDFLAKRPSQGVYASACRCLVWSRIKLTRECHEAAQKDVDFLLRCVRAKGEARGLFFYGLPTGPNDISYDHSVSQMAALGLSAMIPQGFEIPRELWSLTEEAWQRHQLASGAWTYAPGYSLETASMTAAGVATLLITQSVLADPSGCLGNGVDPHVDKGIGWLGAHFDATFDVARQINNLHLEQYALFAISRVGVASGSRYFGAVDWYQRGTDYLIATQQKDGNWTSSKPGGTALALLFVAYGSSPVVLGKLEHAPPPEAGRPGIPDWNQRPQDLLNFTDWMGRQLEHRFNWQVVNLSSPPEILHDAPILFIGGGRALTFTDEEVGTLRQFAEDGGMILGNADCDSEPFTRSFLELGRRAFPGYEFRELPPTHPIYVNEQYKAAKFKRREKVAGLSNGVRELMLLPSADISRAFQHHNEAVAADLYHLFSDIVLYAMDTSGLERKGNTYLVKEDPAVQVTRTIKLARLQYEGNWNPEPGGWRRLAAVLHNTQKIALEVETVKLGDGKLITPPAAPGTASRPTEKEIRQMAAKRIPPAQLGAAMADDPQKADAMIKAKMLEVQAELNAADAARAAGAANFKLAHLTGTDALKLTDPQRQELKKFVEAGGTLIVDAAGGSTEFAASAEQTLRDTFGQDAVQIETPLPLDAPLYQQPGLTVEEVQYRQFARSRISNTRMPQLRGIMFGNRIGVIYSREDLSAGLVGAPVDGVIGYTPASATELMKNIILWAAPKGVKPPVPIALP